MIFSYRTRRFFGRTFRILLIVAVVAVAAWLCWLLWLQRFVVYTPDGVKLDFNLPPVQPGEIAVPGEPGPTISIHYGQVEATKPQDTPTQTKLTGYYVSAEALFEDVAAVKAQLELLPAGTPVMLDVKTGTGYFYYSTQVGVGTYNGIDRQAMDELIAWLADSGLYTIARLPALRDYAYAASNPSAGLPVKGGWLWIDAQRCYWLDPADEDTLSYLMQIVRELRSLGFDEVVFRNFCFPDTNEIVFEGDKGEALASAAQTLVTACATDEFTVSFVTEDPNFVLPPARSRLYLENVAAADVADVAERYALTAGKDRLVFLATNNDTRYNDYGVLRPIDLAH